MTREMEIPDTKAALLLVIDSPDEYNYFPARTMPIFARMQGFLTWGLAPIDGDYSGGIACL
jgi:hypothetical protein